MAIAFVFYPHVPHQYHSHLHQRHPRLCAGILGCFTMTPEIPDHVGDDDFIG